MPAYLVAQVTIHDPVAYAGYQKRVTDAVAKYGGRFIARGGKTVLLEGRTFGTRVALLEFPSLDRAVEFYHSADYAEAKAHRDGGAADFNLFAIEGAAIDRSPPP
ncbi:MAG: DUF1330 domain-containing protein [Alphaproteobacteria bacterium]|nr:DUF1330 domain-containing protein [Alphaproteobacteria bacterium]